MKPLLLSPEMACAYREGRKKMTRRLAKLPRGTSLDLDRDRGKPGPDSEYPYVGPFDGGDEWRPLKSLCPYGQPGDKVPLLTTWAVHRMYDNLKPKELSHAIQIWSYFISDQKPDWCGKLRPGRFLPRHLYSQMPWPKIKDVRAERLQMISEEDAIAEGFDLKLCEAVLYAAAGEVEPDEAYWVTDADHEDLGEGYLCHDCAKALQEKNPGSHISYGCCPESDGPAMCDVCYRPLYLSLTEYGIERELFLECPIDEDRKNFSADGGDACIAAMIAGGYGDLKEEHHGRLAQIGFATLWDSIYEKQGHAWSKNEWVWVVSF